MKFYSQICTTREQSERLLQLGLKKETADMYWILNGYIDDYIARPKEKYTITNIPHIPAWSLHRLIEMLGTSPYEVYPKDNIYEEIVYDINVAVSEGYFNKEYLV